jgi:hypothetical protein
MKPFNNASHADWSSGSVLHAESAPHRGDGRQRVVANYNNGEKDQ